LDHVPSWFMLAVLFGVLGIGFLNFLVSFSLAFIVAVKSRGIHLSQYRRLLKTILRYLIHHPREFILPVPPTSPESFKPLGENNNRDKVE